MLSTLLDCLYRFKLSKNYSVLLCTTLGRIILIFALLVKCFVLGESFAHHRMPVKDKCASLLTLQLPIRTAHLIRLASTGGTDLVIKELATDPMY